MYAEAGMMFPYLQGILPELYHSQQVELFRRLQIDGSLHDCYPVIIVSPGLRDGDRRSPSDLRR